MSSEWELRPLGELSVNFDARRKPVKEVDRVAGPYPYYGASGVVDHVNDYLFDGEYLLVAEDGENLRTRNTPIAFRATGKFWVNNHAHILQGNEIASTRYLEYALLAADITPHLTGAVMPKLTQGNLNKIELPCPSLEGQRAITDVLGALDDRIDNLRATNATLEAIAQAIFKSWFIDFDPVRAKMEGREPEGMDAETAALFPSEFEESELGLIPKGWRAGDLASILKNHREKVAKCSEEARVLSAVASGHLVFPDSHFNKQVHSDDISKYITVPPDFFAYNPSRINIGSIGRNTHNVVGAVSPVYVVFGLECAELTDWFDWWRKTEAARDAFVRLSSGSVRQSLAFHALATIKVVHPPTNIARSYSVICRVLSQRQKEINRHAADLSELRDALLPRLVSGQLRSLTREPNPPGFDEINEG